MDGLLLVRSVHPPEGGVIDNDEAAAAFCIVIMAMTRLLDCGALGSVSVAVPLAEVLAADTTVPVCTTTGPAP